MDVNKRISIVNKPISNYYHAKKKPHLTRVIVLYSCHCYRPRYIYTLQQLTTTEELKDATKHCHCHQHPHRNWGQARAAVQGLYRVFCRQCTGNAVVFCGYITQEQGQLCSAQGRPGDWSNQKRDTL